MCSGFPPAAFCNHCKEFKLPDMRNLYERERLSKFEKKKKKIKKKKKKKRKKKEK